MVDDTCMLCHEDKPNELMWFCGGDQCCADCFEKETGVPAHPSHINKEDNRIIIHNAIEKAAEK